MEEQNKKNVPPKYLYGQHIAVTIVSAYLANHREPSEYDFRNRPINWVTVTDYTFRFSNGGFFEGRLVNNIPNVHRGDIFEAYVYNNKFTYLKSKVTGYVFFDKPVINPEWLAYQKQEKSKRNQEWNKLSYHKRLYRLRFIISILITSGIWLSCNYRNILPFFILLSPCIVLLLNRKAS